MANSLLIAGIVCIVAAVVGGGIKLLGNELPALGSTRRQVLLALVGLAFLIASYVVAHPKPAQAPAATPSTSPGTPANAPAPASVSPTAQASTPSQPSPAVIAPGSPAAEPPALGQPSPAVVEPASPASTSACGPSNGLDCLPRSSGPVSFQYPAAANEAAARNVADHLSTTEGQFQAQKAGATGKASRLCGIVASYDSSPLGKHLAAVALVGGSAGGQATDSCLRMAQNFL